jgi:hypothetical protein
LADEVLFVGVAFELLPAIKELNIGGVAMKGHGCRGGNAQLCALIAMEMARFDSSIGTLSVYTMPGNGVHLSGRVRGTKAKMAPADGKARYG